MDVCKSATAIDGKVIFIVGRHLQVATVCMIKLRCKRGDEMCDECQRWKDDGLDHNFFALGEIERESFREKGGKS